MLARINKEKEELIPGVSMYSRFSQGALGAALPETQGLSGGAESTAKGTCRPWLPQIVHKHGIT